MKDNLSFLKVSESNVDVMSQGICELLFSVHGHRCDPAYWRWCYFNGPAGQSNLTVALRGGRVVGKHGSIYVALIAGGRSHVVGLMTGISILPAERSWDCYRGLIGKYTVDNQKNDLIGWFGVSYSGMVELHRRMGLKHLGQIPIYFGYLDISRILKGRCVPYPLSRLGQLLEPFMGLRRGNEGTGNLDIRPIEDFNDDFDKFWNAVAGNRVVSIVKNAAYLNWRYVKRPGNRYQRLAAYRDSRLEGFVIFCDLGLRYSSGILDLLARDDDPEVIGALLSRVLEELRIQKMGSIIASFPEGSPAAAVLKDMGFKAWGMTSWPTHVSAGVNPEKNDCWNFDLKSCEFSLGDWNLV
jgi:hypothetical protein